MTIGKRLDGKVAIVTGGSSGIGAATCHLFVEHGAKVVIADINAAQGQRLAEELHAAGGDTLFRQLDVTQEPQWQQVVDDVMQRWGRLDIVVNNAGLSGVKGRAVVEETTVANWDAVLAVNATGVMLGTKTALSAMRQSGGGSIINISSIYGIVGSAAGAAYHASKGAVRLFTKAAAVQYATDNIRVNSIHPGFTDTPMTDEIHADPTIRQDRVEQTPMGRLGKPEDIAYGILYLASDEATWVTGSELVIDGGQTAR